MRIRAFGPLIEDHARPHQLKNCSLVIDAHNFFYDFYEDIRLHYEFGAECDQYAKYLKNYLTMFKEANIKCYFIFKGGTKGLEKKITKVLNHTIEQTHLINPVFMTDIHVQVLKEMEFDYFFSEYESKRDCITMARKISCPVLSYDIEFAIAKVQYVSSKSLGKFNGDHISCKLFTQDIFLQELELDMNKLALFILLSDERIFPENTFYSLFRLKHIPLQPMRRNIALLNWLSESLEEEILQDILHNIEITEERLLEELNKVTEIVRGEVNSEVAFDYFFNKCKTTDWFVSGVATNTIAKEYVDLYRSNVLFKQIYGDDNDDFMEPSVNIIKYAYDLLTAFNNDGLKFIRYYYDSKTDKSDVIRGSINKPSSQSDESIFKNGWDNIVSLGLFQHFIAETINFDCYKLEKIPDDAKMLMITLVYMFHISKSQPNVIMFTSEMAYGVLLSYVILGVVQERADGIQNDDLIPKSDCESALNSLHDYFNVKDPNQIMNKDLFIPLKQFQLSLLEMNNLNKLCGSPFEPTTYSKTYNGTFAYNIIYIMKSKGIIPSINITLSSAPTVLKYFHNIIELYKNLIQSD